MRLFLPPFYRSKHSPSKLDQTEPWRGKADEPFDNKKEGSNLIDKWWPGCGFRFPKASSQPPTFPRRAAGPPGKKEKDRSMRVFLWRATMRSLASGLVFLWRAMRADRRWWWDPKACKEGKKTSIYYIIKWVLKEATTFAERV